MPEADGLDAPRSAVVAEVARGDAEEARRRLGREKRVQLGYLQAELSPEVLVLMALFSRARRAAYCPVDLNVVTV